MKKKSQLLTEAIARAKARKDEKNKKENVMFQAYYKNQKNLQKSTNEFDYR
jgi:hypothetical protein